MQNGTPSEKTTTNEKSGVKGNLTFDDNLNYSPETPKSPSNT